MRRTFERYRNVGYRFVTGFLEPGNLPVLEVLDAAQRARQVTGAVAEIGVHHGRLFIALHLLQRGAGKSVAIDLFGDQELNIDKSGRGDQTKFTDNVALWSSMDGVVLHQGDSTKLTADVLLEKSGGPIRFFSVDGGHTEEIVYSDMRLAEETLADGGIVIADDVFNQQWPGVAVGTLKYLADGAKLVPFAIGFNKTLFTQPEYADVLPCRTELDLRQEPSHPDRGDGVRRPRGAIPRARHARGHPAPQRNGPVALPPHVPGDGAGFAAHVGQGQARPVAVVGTLAGKVTDE